MHFEMKVRAEKEKERKVENGEMKGGGRRGKKRKKRDRDRQLTSIRRRSTFTKANRPYRAGLSRDLVANVSQKRLGQSVGISEQQSISEPCGAGQ